MKTSKLQPFLCICKRGTRIRHFWPLHTGSDYLSRTKKVCSLLQYNNFVFGALCCAHYLQFNGCASQFIDRSSTDWSALLGPIHHGGFIRANHFQLSIPARLPSTHSRSIISTRLTLFPIYLSLFVVSTLCPERLYVSYHQVYTTKFNFFKKNQKDPELVNVFDILTTYVGWIKAATLSLVSFSVLRLAKFPRILIG